MKSKNRFSVVFGSTFGLIATIALLAIAGISVLNNMITMISGGALGALSGFMSLVLSTAPMILMAIGMLLAYISSKKGEVNGIGLIKGGVMFNGIVTFIGELIITIVVVIAVFAMIGAASGFSDDGEVFLIVMIGLLVVAIFVAITVLTLMYALKMSGLLGKINDFESDKQVLPTKFLKVITILLVIGSSIQFIGSLISMLTTSLVYEVIDEISYYVDSDAAYLLSMFVGGNTFSKICSFIIAMSTVALYVMIVIMLGKGKYISEVAVKTEESQPVVPAYEEEIDKELNTVQLQDQLQNDLYTEAIAQSTVLIDQSVFNRGSITALSGNEKGYVYPIDEGEEYIIGKDPREASIVVGIDYDSVSRKHCGIKFNAGENSYMVIDYSTNGTYINSIRKLSKGIYVTVPRGTIINLGKENIDYRLD